MHGEGCGTHKSSIRPWPLARAKRAGAARKPCSKKLASRLPSVHPLVHYAAELAVKIGRLTLNGSDLH